MKVLSGFIVAWGALAVAQARPLVVQESARIANPDPATYPYFAVRRRHRWRRRHRDAGALSSTRQPAAIRATSNMRWRSSSFIAPTAAGRRSGQLVVHHHGAFSSFQSGLAMRNGIAALALNPLLRIRAANGRLGGRAHHRGRSVQSRRQHHHRWKSHPVRRQQRPVDGHALREEFRHRCLGTDVDHGRRLPRR